MEEETMESRQFRQGDVLLIAVESVPNFANRVARENGQIVLAHGEATGHAHALREPGCGLYRLRREHYLEVTEEDCVLRHEEHNPIALPVGVYRVIRQREYVPPQADEGRKAMPGRMVMPGRVRYVVD